MIVLLWLAIGLACGLLGLGAGVRVTWGTLSRRGAVAATLATGAMAGVFGGLLGYLLVGGLFSAPAACGLSAAVLLAGPWLVKRWQVRGV